MKKVFKLMIPITFVIAITSCKTEETIKYCATCVESRTSTSTDYCGTDADVNNFISELKRQGSAAGQTWTCTKK